MNNPFFQCCGSKDRFKDRTGLECIGYSPVSPFRRFMALRLIGVEGWSSMCGGAYCKGKYFPSPRVHDDANPALSLCARQHPVKLLLGDMLNHLVDGKNDVVARLRQSVLKPQAAGKYRPSFCVLFREHPSFNTAQCF